MSTVRNKVLIGAMAQADYDQLDSAIQAYVDLDLDKAQSCIEGDKEVNALFEEAKRSITRHIIEHEPDETYALDVLMIANTLNASVIMQSILQSGPNMPLQAFTKE